MYDVIVVGARCAGSPAAMLLAQRGYRVLLVDRATFPSDTLSTHFIKPPGIAMLRRWGLLAQVAASGCPPVTRFRFDYGPVVLAGSPPPLDGGGESYAPRRTVLDAVLVEAAARAGAEVRTAFTVDGVLTDGGRVAGIRGHARSGVTVTERARLVVGADGRHSRVARAVAAPVYRAQPALTCAYYSYWSDVPAAGVIEGYFRPRRAILTFPTNDGQVCVFLQWPRAEFGSVRADAEGQIGQALAQLPGLDERLRAGRRAARLAGTGDLPGYFRTPRGPGWALVGDAGYHQDPLTGQGISDAFRDAQFLAEAIDAGLAGRQPLAEALAGFQRRRDEAATATYELTCQRATLEPPTPQMSRLIAALDGNQDDTDRFFGVIAGTVPIPEFFAPGNIERITGTSTIA
ncbi:MAG TPA: NAD(P)/FAD-dependent oxidoreductase [Streptosporangiaceae bacterium]|nr:NAD(P)/FAD-dependent oxidoreductase [Streptosporangiaceae bacterium]